jgi:hypothetical protein
LGLKRPSASPGSKNKACFPAADFYNRGYKHFDAILF